MTLEVIMVKYEMKSTGNNNIGKLDYIKSKMCYISKDMINSEKATHDMEKNIY